MLYYFFVQIYCIRNYFIISENSVVGENCWGNWWVISYIKKQPGSIARKKGITRCRPRIVSKVQNLPNYNWTYKRVLVYKPYYSLFSGDQEHVNSQFTCNQ